MGAVTVSQHRSLRSAAETLHVRQSTLSRRMHDLELRVIDRYSDRVRISRQNIADARSWKWTKLSWVKTNSSGARSASSALRRTLPALEGHGLGAKNHVAENVGPRRFQAFAAGEMRIPPIASECLGQ